MHIAHDENSWVSSNARYGWARYLFYRPTLWIGNLYFWGWRPGVFRRSDRFRSILGSVLDTTIQNPKIPVGMAFHSVLPETRYSIAKTEDKLAIHPSEEIVWSEGASSNGLVVEHRTNSYFHFITEVIPLVLHHKGDDSVGVIVTRGWQIDALEAFGIKTRPTRPHRSRHLFSLRKETWGVYPREDMLLHARATLLETVGAPSRETLFRPGLLVDRSEDTSSTGRLLSPLTNQTLRKELGLDHYDPALYAIRQQFQKFSDNQVFVGPHGSAFANIVVAREKSVVVEINHNDKSQWHVKRLCDIFGFSYRLCPVAMDTFGNLEMSETLIKSVKFYLDTRF